MCAGVMIGLTALSGLMQYKQQQAAADAQASMYRAQAQAAEQNANVEGRKQESIADKYANEARTLRDRRKVSEGTLRAQTGAAGIDMSGSAMDILSSGYEAYGRDQMNLLTNQRNENYNSRVAQSQYEAEAANNRKAADNVEEQAKLQGISTILGTAASITGLSMASGGSSAASSGGSGSFGSVSSNIGHNTAATFNNGSIGFSNIGNWGASGFAANNAKKLWNAANYRIGY